MDALEYGGGNGADGAARLLLREATVALLNASHPEVHFPLSVEEIVSLVNEALAGMNRNDMLRAKQDVGRHNGQGCPLH